MISCLTTIDYFNIAESIAIIIASGAAIFGINSWRRETKWKRKYELIEEVLTLFYQAEESIIRIRNPFSTIEEGSSREKTPNESPKDTEILNRAYVVYERYEKEKDGFIQLRKIKHRFKAVFGHDSVSPFQEIENVLKEIFIATHILAKIYWPRQGKVMNEKEFEEHMNKMLEYESIFWGGLKDPDPIDTKLHTIIENIEEICAKDIKK